MPLQLPMTPYPSIRSPGQHARATVHRLRLRTLVTLGVLAVATTILGRTFGLHDLRFLGSEIALLAAIFVVSRYVMPLVERHDRGATGEEHVGALLEDLRGQGWSVIHDLSFGHGNVDHILIGPAGVFTIETKSHPGPVRVARLHGETIRQAQAQQRLVATITGEPVEPLVVFSRAWVDRPLSRRKGVRVMPARMLIGYLAGRSKSLTDEQIGDAHRKVVMALGARAKSAGRGAGPEGHSHRMERLPLRRLVAPHQRRGPRD